MPYERKTVDITISDELRDVLIEFESDSLVAKLLLKKRHDKESLVENPVNFISIAHDRGRISYLTHDRIERLTPEQYWSSSRRFSARPGSFISKIFKDIPDKEVEKFSNLYRSHANKVLTTFKIVEGDTILKYYNINSYAAERGSLGASCMKHEHCQNFLGIYTENPDVVKMLVMLDRNQALIGRALLWSFDGYKIMDRIYTVSDEEFVFQFKKWATENGYLYKCEQNWFNTLNFENLSTPKQELMLEVPLKNIEFRRYPYVDTFKFLNIKDGKLRNFIPKDLSYIKTLTASDGGSHHAECLYFDDIDRVLRHPGECVRLNYLSTEDSIIRTHSNNVKYSESNDEYILKKDAIYVEEMKDFIFNSEFERFNKPENIKRRLDYFIARKKDREERALSNSSTENPYNLYESFIRLTNLNTLSTPTWIAMPSEDNDSGQA